MSSAESNRITYIVTHPITAEYLLKGQLNYLAERGFDVALLTSPGAALDRVAARDRVSIFPVPMKRSVRPLADLTSLMRLVRILRTHRPTLVNSSTPKAGLLGILAAWLVGVPHRVYLVRGLRQETVSGVSRLVLSVLERLTALLATEIVCVSASLATLYRSRGFAGTKALRVLGPGSSNGVDTDRFQPRPGDEKLKQELGIDPSALVIGFVGRMTRDKGIADLARVYLDAILPKWASAHLVLVGDFEEGDAVGGEVKDKLRQHPQVHISGFRNDTPLFYGLMDLVAFPSYREGFPNVVLEAAASGLPVVAYDVTGSRDAVKDQQTGRLVPAGDIAAFAEAIDRYLDNPDLRHNHGKAGRTMVLENFQQELVWKRWEQLYSEILGQSRDVPEVSP